MPCIYHKGKHPVVYITLRKTKTGIVFYNVVMVYLERIKGLREDRMLKQQDIADQIYVSQRTYSDYETGRIRIPVEILVRLAKYYNVSVDYISGASSVRKSFPKE